MAQHSALTQEGAIRSNRALFPSVRPWGDVQGRAWVEPCGQAVVGHAELPQRPGPTPAGLRPLVVLTKTRGGF